MGYYFMKSTDLGFDAAIERVTEILKEHGFGVLTEIDVTATMKKKLDVDFPKYRILGACNPPFAHKALSAEPFIGTMLPCNVIVRENEEGKTQVAAVDPISSMQAIESDDLAIIAGEVRDILKKVIEKV